MMEEWLYPISGTCLDLAHTAKKTASAAEEVAVEAKRTDPNAGAQGQDADVIVIEARQAFRSAELLARAAAHHERDYPNQADQDHWTTSAPMCACLSPSTADLQPATGAG
jgi:hypothetical protein